MNDYEDKSTISKKVADSIIEGAVQYSIDELEKLNKEHSKIIGNVKPIKSIDEICPEFYKNFKEIVYDNWNVID